MSKSKAIKKTKKVTENIPVEKDDGSRWTVRFADNHPTMWLRGLIAYPGSGMTKHEARRLAEGLYGPVELICVNDA